MRKEIKELVLSNSQLRQLSYRTCQWWNAVFIHAKSFLEALDNDDHWEEPWDETDSVFVAERTLFIIAIHHAIEHLQKLDIELQRANDYSLQTVLRAIERVASLQDIKNLRDMNEHGLEYLVEKGHKQAQFHSTVTRGNYKMPTAAFWTIIHGDAQMFLLGNVPMDRLLLAMKEQLPVIQAKTKEIFYKSFSGEQKNG